MPTVTLNVGSSFGSEYVHGERSVSVDSAESFAIPVEGSKTNDKYEIQWDKDTVKTLTIHADGGACTIKTNSTGSPDDTVALAAGEIRIFGPSTGTNPFPTANVTALYLSTSTDSTTLRGIIGKDLQP